MPSIEFLVYLKPFLVWGIREDVKVWVRLPRHPPANQAVAFWVDKLVAAVKVKRQWR